MVTHDKLARLVKVNVLGYPHEQTLLLAILSLSLFAGCIQTGEGTAQDTIYQIQQAGLVWKTYDVWLTNDHPTESYSAIYCPEPDATALLTKIKAAVASKAKCTITYHNEMFVAPWRCNSNTIIDDIACE